jgi:hypothetical protein
MGDFCNIFNTILMSIIMIMAGFIVLILKGKPDILILNTPDRITWILARVRLVTNAAASSQHKTLK